MKSPLFSAISNRYNDLSGKEDLEDDEKKPDEFSATEDEESMGGPDSDEGDEDEDDLAAIGGHDALVKLYLRQKAGLPMSPEDQALLGDDDEED